MSGVCLLVAATVVAELPASEFTLAWRHSVEKTRWEEHYRIEDRRLTHVAASVEGHGAGMEPGADARFAEGRWTWRPALAPLSELRLALSDAAGDYELCWDRQCKPLRTLAASGADASVVVRPCR
jgi:hypothetical protein